MLSIMSILEFISEDLARNPERFTIVDHQQLLDNKTGVHFHLYDDYFKLSYGEETVATKSDFTELEQQMLWKIKQAITDPAVAEENTKMYKERQAERREHISRLFENPKPTLDSTPAVEANTTPYTG